MTISYDTAGVRRLNPRRKCCSFMASTQQEMIYCYESTIDIVIDDYNLRLWLNHDATPENLIEEQELAKKLFPLTGYSMKGLAEKVIRMVPNLNAIQVKNGAVGIMLYTRPFCEHGHE